MAPRLAMGRMDRAIVNGMGPVLAPRRFSIRGPAVAADDRSGPVSGLSSSPPNSVRAEGRHSATFEVAGWRVELSAGPGAARLVVVGDAARDTHVIEPGALCAWATAITKLLALQPAASARGRAAVRAPFLVDRDGRPSIAVEALLSEQGVGYRLLVGVGQEPLATLVTTEDVVRGMAQAAAGIGMVVRRSG